jgi:predicted HTH transcriptional regulator
MNTQEEIKNWLKKPKGLSLEFKTAENQFSRDRDLPDYCAALANEGGGKSIFIKASLQEFFIESPGGFPPGITAENILEKSYWRNNRSIAEILEKAKLVERAGQGMNDILIQLNIRKNLSSWES